MSAPLHKVQVGILTALRYASAARFSTLMHPTGLQSDSFKFYLRTLAQLQLVVRTPEGLYQLTPKGKEFANNIDKIKRQTRQQPKLSVLLLVPRRGVGGVTEYLFQQRKRAPFYEFWSAIGGPVQWGEPAEAAAERELFKQTGLQADCDVRAFYRKRDYIAGTSILLEDKLFAVLVANNVTGTLQNTWHGGHNQWMSVDGFTRQPQYFSSVCEAIALVNAGKTYAAQDAFYADAEY